MSGLYNALFPGSEARGALFAGFLGFPSLDAIGRLRDAWPEIDPEHDVLIRVYTRNGGGNRADYVTAIDGMRAHPLFVRDADDKFDSTYASFWFRVPDEWKERLRDVASPPVDMDERWKKTIDSFKTDSE
jgi:hypothetical protein